MSARGTNGEPWRRSARPTDVVSDTYQDGTLPHPASRQARDGVLVGSFPSAERRDRAIACVNACDGLELVADAPAGALSDLVSTAFAVLHELTHGEASEGRARDITWCAQQLRDALAPFGAEAPAEEEWSRDDERARDALLLAGAWIVADELLLDVVRSWSDGQVRVAETWAIALHFAASDNDDVEVPPTPAHVAAISGHYRVGVVYGLSRAGAA